MYHDGTWERLNSMVREQGRMAAGREAAPHAGRSDSDTLLRIKRFSRDYEFGVTTSDAMIYAAKVHLMLRRLAPDR